MEYKYYFGTYNEGILLSQPHIVSDTSKSYTIPAGVIHLTPWELKHVQSYSEAESTSSSTVGIPDKPAECVYIYDTAGPIRTITISGVRYDSEEEISNLDFMHTQFNKVTVGEEYDPLTGNKTTIDAYSVGIEWLTSTMQSTMKGYVLYRIADNYSEATMDSRVPITKIADNVYGEIINVGITAFNYSFSNDMPGVINYTLTLVERRAYDTGPIYREYVPKVKEVKQ